MYKLNRTEWSIITTCIIIIMATFYSLYKSSNPNLEKTLQQKIGTITFRYKVAQKRHSQRAIWENVDQDSIVYNNNFIRTDDLSEATIHLENNTQIELDPNSMIVLQYHKGKSQIKVTQGSVLINSKGAKRNQSVIIINNKKLSLQKAISKIVQKLDTSQAQISVREGKAIFSLKIGDQVIEQGESVTLDNKNNFSKVRKIPLIAPKDNSHFITNHNYKKITLQWKEATPTNVYVASDIEFLKNVIKSKVNASQTTVNLTTGIHYWKIEQTLAGKTVFSSTYKLNIIKSPKIRLISPFNTSTVKGQKSNTTRNKGWVFFSWKKILLANSYNLYIAQDREMKLNKQTFETYHNSFATLLKAGKYFWQVKINSILKVPLINKEIFSFTVKSFGDRVLHEDSTTKTTKDNIKKGKVKILSPPSKPKILYPYYNAVVDMSKHNSLSFRWQSSNATSYQLLLFYKSKLIMNKVTRVPYYYLTNLSILDEGFFTLKIIARNSNRETKNTISRFKITLSQKLEKPKIK